MMSSKGRNACLLLICLVSSALLAGCSSASPVASAPAATLTLVRTLTPTHTPTPTPTLPPPPPQPTPIPPQGWATHTSARYHYTIQYPANWIASGDFDVWNWNPQQRPDLMAVNAPLLKIEVLPLSNPSQLSPLQYYTQDQQHTTGPACSDPATRATTVGGRDALEAICPSQNKDGYWVSDGPDILYIFQINAVKGQPSSVFTQMIASFTFTS
ncbi:MAG TPA: hypothetical protein VH599_03045 [Ktedonobacterales bacterium]|jgi:hypothetical protein